HELTQEKHRIDVRALCAGAGDVTPGFRTLVHDVRRAQGKRYETMPGMGTVRVMKKVFAAVALTSAFVIAFASNASATSGAELIAFQVNCTLPTFLSGGDSTTCGGGISDYGVGTAKNGAFNPAASMSLNYNTPSCFQFNATGAFSIGSFSGSVIIQQTGAFVRMTYSFIDRWGYAHATGSALGTATTTQAFKLANACQWTTQTDFVVTFSAVGEILM
ncbi:MAG: hypothetical protein WAT66_02835, partial [Actinomycetota bacterium]